MKQCHFSPTPTVLRHWIPLEFSKDVADYPSTRLSNELIKSNRQSSVNSQVKIFHNEELFRKFEEAKAATPEFKLVFKNKSCKLFEPRKKIHSGHLIRKIVKTHLQSEDLESKESAMYDKLYDSALDKHYIYRYLGTAKPLSSFSVSKRRSTVGSCDIKKAEADTPKTKQTKRISLASAMNSRRDSRTVATRENDRRLTWLLGDGLPNPPSSTNKADDLMISGSRAAKGEIVEHWKRRQAEIIDLMKRIKIL